MYTEKMLTKSYSITYDRYIYIYMHIHISVHEYRITSVNMYMCSELTSPLPHRRVRLSHACPNHMYIDHIPLCRICYKINSFQVYIQHIYYHMLISHIIYCIGFIYIYIIYIYYIYL